MAGVNNKILKLFDLRLDQSGVKSSALSTFTRAVYGVCVDPFLQYRVASQYDDQVCTKKICYCAEHRTLDSRL